MRLSLERFKGGSSAVTIMKGLDLLEIVEILETLSRGFRKGECTGSRFHPDGIHRLFCADIGSLERVVLE